MKKSKRLRFYALIQKQSRGELTAAEQTELNELSQLVSQHPNAAADEDDTGEGDDKKKKDGEEAEGDEDKDKEKSEGDDKKDDDKDKSKSKAKTKTTLAAVIGAAFASARAGTGTAAGLAEANKNLATVSGERDQARTELATARTDLATARSSLTAANGQLALITGYLGLPADAFAGKDAETVTGLIGTAVNGLVTEQLGTLGFPRAELPASTGSDKADTKADLVRQFNAITDANQRAEFYAKHSAQLLS